MIRFACSFLLLAALAYASDPAIVPTGVIVQGQTSIPGLGFVTLTKSVAVNSQGQWIVFVDTDHPTTSADEAIVDATGVRLREGQALAKPVGATLVAFGDIDLNDSGLIASNLQLGNVPSTANSGIAVFDKVVVQEGSLSTAPGFGPNTKYLGFGGTKINELGQMLIYALVDDPTTSFALDHALVSIDFDPTTGFLQGETLAVKSGDVLPGQAAGLEDFGFDIFGYEWSEQGDVVFRAETTDVAAVDSNVYLNQSLLAREGSPSPLSGLAWDSLESAVINVSPNGLHTVFAGPLAPSGSGNAVLVRDGAVVAKVGATLPDIAPYSLTWQFFFDHVHVMNSGHVVWFGAWNDPNPARGEGLFIDDKLVVEKGVTTINGMVVENVTGVWNTTGSDVSANGRYILFTARVAGGLRCVALIDLGPWDRLGDGLAGANGEPRLLGAGPMSAGQPVSFSITGAAPNAPAAFVFGLTPIDFAPFYGGTLVPSPQLVLAGFNTNSNGSFTLTALWPAGVPSGTPIFAQALVQDAGAPFGVAISNAIVGATP